MFSNCQNSFQNHNAKAGRKLLLSGYGSSLLSIVLLFGKPHNKLQKYPTTYMKSENSTNNHNRGTQRAWYPPAMSPPVCGGRWRPTSQRRRNIYIYMRIWYGNSSIHTLPRMTNCFIHLAHEARTKLLDYPTCVCCLLSNRVLSPCVCLSLLWSIVLWE